ncbi:MAG: Tyrosine--tRNA ligase [Candidatus Saccharibacteria bacterium]|nr:Tyrosine--tRNA ligase [Candidatus Saccharibacteria bacterium]
MTLSEELIWRGFINQTTIQDLKQLDDGPRTFYHGFDASADSQTIGNLAAMMFDMVFMRHGYKAILLAGGATSLVGDPGGKDSERPMQTIETIMHNTARAEKQLETVFNGQEFTLVNNLDWTKDLRVLDFLRDIGKYFNMSSLVQRDYISTRLGEGGAGISYTEFSYTLLQGMDYLHLFDTHNVTLQLGGSDQWGNCLSGVDLVRKARGATVDVITLPLIINKATGKKFGKSEDGAVWLDAEKTSVFKFYQFWLNADDEGVIDYMKVYTSLSKDEIDQISNDHQSQPSARIAQRQLAHEVTKIVHGEDRTASVERVTNVLFGGQAFHELSGDDLEVLAGEIPTVHTGTSLVEVLVVAEVATSNGDARRLIESGAVSVNGEKVSEDVTIRETSLVKKGKNSFILVR